MKTILAILLISVCQIAAAIPVERQIQIPNPFGILYACIKQDNHYVGVYSVGRAWMTKVIFAADCAPFLKKGKTNA